MVSCGADFFDSTATDAVRDFEKIDAIDDILNDVLGAFSQDDLAIFEHSSRYKGKGKQKTKRARAGAKNRLLRKDCKTQAC